jgi:hypothetical protein
MSGFSGFLSAGEVQEKSTPSSRNKRKTADIRVLRKHGLLLIFVIQW